MVVTSTFFFFYKAMFIDLFMKCVSCFQVQSDLDVDDIVFDLLAEKYYNYVDVR